MAERPIEQWSDELHEQVPAPIDDEGLEEFGRGDAPPVDDDVSAEGDAPLAGMLSSKVVGGPAKLLTSSSKVMVEGSGVQRGLDPGSYPAVNAPTVLASGGSTSVLDGGNDEGGNEDGGGQDSGGGGGGQDSGGGGGGQDGGGSQGGGGSTSQAAPADDPVLEDPVLDDPFAEDPLAELDHDPEPALALEPELEGSPDGPDAGLDDLDLA